MSDLYNESIFITGGGSGLGLALVERFIEEGAQVATLELSAAKSPVCVSDLANIFWRWKVT